nr:MAG TPA: hypothetical protein [Caudoviricetes sp.]
MIPVFLPYVSAKRKKKLRLLLKSGQVSSVISMQEKMQKRLQGLC